MRKWIFKTLGAITGKNADAAPIALIREQLNEPRQLPMGRKEFDEWSDRIIGGALMKPGKDEDAEIFKNSQRFALANMLMHLGPTESHKPDAFFIHSLRKFAVNQVADTVRREIHEAAKARLAAEEAAAKKADAPISAAEAMAQEPAPLVRIGAATAP